MEVRKNNIKRVISYLYNNATATNQELVQALHLSQPTVFNIIKKLTEQGMVVQNSSQESSGGRRPMLNKLEINSSFSIGIDITKDYVRIILVNLGAEIVEREYAEISFEDKECYYNKLKVILDSFINKVAIDKEKVIGIGISVPAIVEDNCARYGRTLETDTFCLDRFSLLGYQNVMVINDAKAAGLAETWNKTEEQELVYLHVSKGVGGAIINREGMLFPQVRAGEFGHMTIFDNGMECSCGKKGCLEAYCSINVIKDTFNMELEDFFYQIEKGSRDHLKFWEEYIHNLAIGINNLRVIFNTDIVIGGEISPYIEKYKKMLLEELSSRSSFGEIIDYVHIGIYREIDCAVGAALLLFSDLCLR